MWEEIAGMVWVHFFPQGEGSLQANAVILTDHLFSCDNIYNVSHHLKFLTSILAIVTPIEEFLLYCI